MGRPKGSKNNKKVKLIKCLTCGVEQRADLEFYQTKSPMFKNVELQGKAPFCKKCISSQLDVNNMDSVHAILRQLDIKFDAAMWQSAVESSKETFGRYISMANSMPQFDRTSYKDSVFEHGTKKFETHSDIDKREIEIPLITEKELASKEECMRLIGSDPFENENPADKNRLYNSLIDYLDEGTLEDGFKLNGVISIVRTFNQIRNLDDTVAKLSNDFAENFAKIKALADTKQKLNKTALDIAKDNGISINHSNNKNKGAGTLSGILKDLQEKGITESSINIYDIETAAGMKQVADISNKSIITQLMFDENDYSQMLSEQREMIQKLKEDNAKLSEENRLLKIKIKEGDGNV